MKEKSKTGNSEKKIEARLKELVEEKGGLCLKLLPFQFRGLPDRICLLPKGRIFFAELKSTNGKLSKIQLWVHKRFRSLGFDVYVIDTIEKLEELFKKDTALESVLRKVAQVSDMSMGALKLKTRKREIVEARQAYMILARLTTDHSLNDIGKLVNKNHATVIHAFKNAHLDTIKTIIHKTGLI
jgi:hypothetical protein